MTDRDEHAWPLPCTPHKDTGRGRPANHKRIEALKQEIEDAHAQIREKNALLNSLHTKVMKGWAAYWKLYRETKA